MHICVIGTGYVGLVAAACLAEMGNQVTCVDVNAEKIQALQEGRIPIYEPGLEELVLTNAREERLSFTTSLEEAVKKSLICIIAVGTPQSSSGEADLSAVFDVCRGIADAMDSYRVVVVKSTVPVGTSDRLGKILSEHTTQEFSLVSNPEFLKQGDAVNDFLKPARVVIGCSDARSLAVMQELYSPFLRTGNPILSMDVRSAEMTKYAANAFLATKISFINEMSMLCDKVGADVALVRLGISMDPRIGQQFLFPGLGFGGSCFPKDVEALQFTAHEFGCDMPMMRSVLKINQRQRLEFVDKVVEHFGSDLEGRVLAMWGLAFKPRTDDLREAPSLTIAERLLERGATLRVFDPKATQAFLERFPGQAVIGCDSAFEALVGSEAMMLITEWNEFRRPDWDRMRKTMKSPVVFDGRNIYEPDRMIARGFSYYSIGRPARRQPRSQPAEPARVRA